MFSAGIFRRLLVLKSGLQEIRQPHRPYAAFPSTSRHGSIRALRRPWLRLPQHSRSTWECSLSIIVALESATGSLKAGAVAGMACSSGDWERGELAYVAGL